MTSDALPVGAVALNTVMMDSTFKISGPADLTKPNLISSGTGFLVGRPVPGDPNRLYYVLVTAAHVINGTQGDTATLVLRVKTAAGGYKRTEHKLPIRKGATPLWTRQPTADVAVMYVDLPANLSTQLVPQDFLATDTDFQKYEFHPGDEVFTVGYPYVLEANKLRSRSSAAAGSLLILSCRLPK